MRMRRAKSDAVDPRLAAYVAEHWDDLLDEVADDHLDRAEVVLDALTRVARARPPGDDAALGSAVRREIARAAARRLRRSRAGPRSPDDLTAVDVVEVAPLAGAGGSGGWQAATPEAVAPEPVEADPVEADPVEALRARVRRARRRRAVSLALSAAAVAVAVVLVVTDGGGPGPGATGRGMTADKDGAQPMGTASMNPVALPRSPESRPTGVAAGGGNLWTLELHPSGRRPVTTVVERDPSTGRREASYQAPGEDFGISYALGRVWVWGVQSGIRNASVVTALNPVTGTSWTKAVDTDVIQAAAFTAHRAWFTEDGLARVVAVTPAGRARAIHLRLADASHIAATGPGSVVVSGDSDIMQVLPTGRPTLAENAPPTLLASTPTYGVWIGEGGDLFYRPSIAAPAGLHLRLSLRAALVFGDPAHGVYVATSSNDPQHFDPYLVYYSPQSLREADPQPTARLDGRVRVESMAAGRHGGLVFVTTEGQIEAWNPAVVTVSPGSDHVDHALG